MNMYDFLSENVAAVVALNVFWGIIVLLGKLVNMWASVLSRKDSQRTKVRDTEERRQIRENE